MSSTPTPRWPTRPDLQLLILLALTAVVSTSICPSSFFFPSIGCVLPENPYVYIGEILTLDCHTLISNHSEDLFFTWRNDVNISQEYQRVVSPSTLQLNRPINESDVTEHGVPVNCRNSTNGFMGSGQVVRMEYYPRQVYNWTAQVDDWTNLTLKWETGKYINWRDISLTVQWRAADADIWKSCSEFSFRRCFLNSSIYTNSSTYQFNITVTNTERHDSTVTQISLNPDDYVKPAPVTTTEVELSSRCVTLHWIHSRQYSRSLIYKVTVLRGILEVKTRTFNETMGTVCDLRPNTLYTFSVSARSELGGYWSDEVDVTNRTFQDKPERGVSITQGSFHVGVCGGNQRDVAIFLKPPDVEYENGPLDMYTAVFEADDGSPDITSQQLVSQDPTLTVSLPCDVDYRVQLSVNNSIGFSPVSYLYIPRLGTVLSPDTVRVSVNGSTVQAIWKVATNIDPLNFTIFWCKKPDDTTSVRCTSPPSWQTVDGSKRSAFIPISSDIVTTYLFAVSMTTTKGSSGMKLSECVFDVNKAFDSKTKPQIDGVFSKPDLGLTVRWSMPVCDNNLLVTYYTVQLCPDNLTQHCVNKTTSSEEREQVFDTLEEGHNYTVRLQEISLAGLRGPFSDPVFGVPVYNRLKPGWIAAIAIGGIFLIVFFCVYMRIKCRERYAIKIPGIEHLKDHDSPPTLPNRSITLEIPDDQQRLSTDSGQGSPESELTSNLIRSDPDDSGHHSCDQFTSGQTEMTDISGSCPEICVHSSSSDQPGDVKPHNEVISDESDASPYVTADGGAVHQALVPSGSSEAGAPSITHVAASDKTRGKTNQESCSDVSPYTPFDKVVANDQKGCPEQVGPDSVVTPYTPESAVDKICETNKMIGPDVSPYTAFDSVVGNDQKEIQEKVGTDASASSNTTVSTVDKVCGNINQAFSQNSGSDSSAPSYTAVTAVDNMGGNVNHAFNQTSGSDSSAPSYTTVTAVDNMGGNVNHTFNQTSGSDASASSYTAVTAVDNMGGNVNHAFNQTSGSDSSASSYTAVTAVDNMGGNVNHAFNQTSGSDSSAPSYTTVTQVDNIGGVVNQAPNQNSLVQSLTDDVDKTSGETIQNSNPDVSSYTTFDQVVGKNHSGPPAQDLPDSSPCTIESVSKTCDDKQGHGALNGSIKPDVASHVVKQQTAGGYVDPNVFSTDTAGNKPMSARVATRETPGYVDPNLFTTDTAGNKPMSASVATRDTPGYVDLRAGNNDAVYDERGSSANVATQPTTGCGNVDPSAVNNDTVCDESTLSPSIELSRFDKLQEGAVQNENYATFAQVGFLGKQASQDTEVTQL